MPIYEVTQDSTGITLEMEGDTPPSQQTVDAAFKQYAAMNPSQQKGFVTSLTDAVLGPAPEVVTPTQPPAAPIKALEGVETTLRAPMTFRERLQQPEIQAKRFPALAALEDQIAQSIGLTTISKPAGSKLEQGVGAVFEAPPGKREAFKQAFEAAGNLIGPKTAAAAGVIGEATADFVASPGGIATLGIGTGLRSVASIPKVLQAVEGEATASSLLRAADTARIAQNLERVAVAGFTKPTVDSALLSTREAVKIIDSEAPAEEKVRAATQAGLSLLFTGLLGAGARESFRSRTGLLDDAQAMETLAGRQIAARDAALNLKKVREEIAFTEANLPERGVAGTITPEEARNETQIRARLAETRALMDQALNEAVAARVIDTGEMTAIERLRAQGAEVFAPERIGEGPRPTPQSTAPVEGMLPRRLAGQEPFVEPLSRELPIEAEVPPPSGKPLRTAAEIRAQRAGVEPRPLETTGEKLSRALEQNDQRVAAEAITEALESGAAQGEPVVVTRKLIEAELGIGKRRVGRRAAEEIITRETEQAKVEAEKAAFNEAFDNVINKLIAEDQVRQAEQARQVRQIEVEQLRKRREEILAKNPRLSAEERRALIEEGLFVEQPPSPPVELPVGQYPPEGFGTGVIPSEAEMARRAEVRAQAAIRGQAKAQQAKGRFSQAAESLTQSLENLRVDVTPGVGALPIVEFLGQSWNGALVVAQSMIKGGAKVADAIEKAVRYVKYDFQGKFDEAQLRSALASALSETPKIIPGAGQKPRTAAARIVGSTAVPLEVRQALAASPEASYTNQKMKEVSDTTSRMTADQLSTDLATTDSNTRIASGIELFNRRINSGDTVGALDMARVLSKLGTQLGQLVNQFKFLKSSTPDGLVALVDASIRDAGGKGLTPELANKLKAEMEVFARNRDALDGIDNEWAGAIEANAPEETINSIKSRRAEVEAATNAASTDLNIALAKANPASAADLFLSMVQGSVLSPLSIARNILYNTINAAPREVADMSAATIDKLVTGGRDNTFNINARTIGRIKAFYESLPQATKVVLKGSDAIPYEVGKDTGNPLNFQRSWKNIFDALTTGTVESPSLLAKDVVAGTLGVLPDVLLRLTVATDIPFKAAQRAATIEEFGRRVGLSENQIELAKKNIDKVKITDEQAAAGKKGLTEDQIDQINFESARAVYQQDNAATQAVGNINRWIQNKMGPGGYIPYRLVTLFQKTPINVLGEILSFTPGVGLMMLKSEKMTPRERNILLSKQIIGTVAVGAFSQLYDKGIISAPLDTPAETEKARQLALSQGAMPPGAINLTALNRYTKGGDVKFKPGDNVVDLTVLGLGGALASMVGMAKRVKEQSRTGENDILATSWGALIGNMNFVMQQSFLKGTADFINLINSNPKQSFQRFAKNMLVTAASPVAPNILAAIDRSDREYMPVLKEDTILGSFNNELNRRMKALRLILPGETEPDKLPLKRDLWGEAIPQTPPGRNPWIYNLLDPIRMKAVQADPLNADIYRLWRRTGEERAIPSLPMPNMEVRGVKFEKMTPEQYDRYAQLVGFYRRTLAEKVYMSGAFAKGGDETKLDLLGRAYSEGQKMGKYKFLQELKANGQSLTPLTQRRGFVETE